MKELLLAQNVSSESSISGIARPTFSFKGFSQSSSSSSVSSRLATMYLSADSSSVQVGNIFKVTISLNSGTNTIKSYKVKLNFTSSVAEVLDYVGAEPGIQVNVLDINFIKKTNTVDNSAGTIDFSLEGTTAVIVNKPVALALYST